MEIKKETARKLYDTAPEWFKEQLEAAFGKDSFRKINFEDIKTFEDACQALDIDPDAVWGDIDTPDEIAYKKLKVIIQAINQGWIPDWNNTNQRKWYPWFNLSSGFGFGVSDCDYGNTSACAGSRLCFETEEKSDYAAKQFLEIYKEFVTITK